MFYRLVIKLSDLKQRTNGVKFPVYALFNKCFTETCNC